MKCRIIIDKDRPEEVTVYAHQKSRLTDEIAKLCEEESLDLVGYVNDEIIRLNLYDICCFTVEDGKVFAMTYKEKIRLKCRLYTLEEHLPDSFVKINKSCIANIKMIDRFNASISGTLSVKFKNGYVDYVSRRCLKSVKERIGM